MEVALTFGSLGDIIQLCQLAVQLSRAVEIGCHANGNSAVEYQELRNDLDTLVRILMQVVATYEQRESSPYLSGLDSVTKDVVDRCAGQIENALQHFQPRYQGSLLPGGSGNKVKDVFKKIDWSTRESERIKDLRDRLQDGIQRLSLLSNLVAEKTARVDNATMLARIEEVQHVAAQQSCLQQEILGVLEGHREATKQQTRKLEEVNQQLAVQGLQSRGLFAAVKDAVNGILEVKTSLVQVSQNVISLQLLASNISRPLDPTKELPVIFDLFPLSGSSL